jgi:hypothetical protein
MLWKHHFFDRSLKVIKLERAPKLPDKEMDVQYGRTMHTECTACIQYNSVDRLGHQSALA